MKVRRPITATIRPKRQLTLPKEICDQLELKPGDVLNLTVENSTLIATAGKKVALDALREIQEAFQRSGITEEELLESGTQIRRELAEELYGKGK